MIIWIYFPTMLIDKEHICGLWKQLFFFLMPQTSVVKETRILAFSRIQNFPTHQISQLWKKTDRPENLVV